MNPTRMPTTSFAIETHHVSSRPALHNQKEDIVSSPLSLRRIGAVIAAGALLVSLAACAPPASTTADDGGTLRIAVPGSTADSIDPHFTRGTSADVVRYRQLFDGLTELDGTGQLRYMLAESITSNDDATVWTIKLRDGVKLHSGRQFVADDVIATIDRIIAPDSTAVGKSQISFIPEDGIKKIDDLTVEVTLDKPYGPFAQVWTNKYLKMVPADFDPAKPDGTGPFVYQTFTAGQSSTFTRNADYWDGAPKVAEVVITDFADNEAAINALKGGQVDIAYSVPLNEAPALETTPGVKILNSPSDLYINLAMRTDVAPFDDPRVREAFRLIADRQEMVDVALNGYGVVANDYVGRYSSCGDPDVPQREQDIDKAKALLAEAGQSNLSIELATVNGTAGMVEAAQVFAEQAAKAGITVTAKTYEEAAYLENQGNWTFAVDFFSGPYLQLAARTLLPGGSANETHWDDATYNALAAEAFATADDAARCQVELKMKEVEYQSGGNIIWGFVNRLSAYSDAVKGLQEDSTGEGAARINDVTIEH